ncbi:P2R1A-PPP2R2A-interacting phosphatase regulator 1-like [Macrosteles quadrilineatus]|uniref:P2R1A-PPP2R2A-interacting phosphatase regulator 1-like n=1 Tax=Macrosteles quadrilineatus TaxID=74068 RepID=UPI0023E23289|nr:P2R1A-PPP2R2A-interacting phosphatase regulator 1-like [Macrosteles quadrilineatus]
MSNPPVKMEVDIPASLKRSSSAPMINQLNPTMTTSATTATTSRESTTFNVFSSMAPRTRRFSASFTSGSTAPLLSPRLTPRISQLRQEECLDVAVGRETAHERELNNTMVMSQSWEDLTIVGNSPKGDAGDRSPKPRVGLCDPLHVHLPSLSPVCSSPSPTRMLGTKQVFSPNVWKTNLSPSPTRKFTTRRSLSPIALRTPTLGPIKRKFDLDDNEPPAKRTSMGLLMPQSRLDLTASPLAGSLSSVGTPESLSSGDSPVGFSYRNVDSPNTTSEHTSSDQQSSDHPMDQPTDTQTRMDHSSSNSTDQSDSTDHPMRDLTTSVPNPS